MKPGNHAAGDGSFGRSAGGAAGRGVALLAVALLIGIVLLNATDAEPPGTRLTTGPSGGEDAAPGPDKGRTAAPTTTASTTTLPGRPPPEVKVIVANAAGVQGAAGRASDILKPAGYNVLAPTNTKGETAVYFVPGYEREAAAVATALGFPGASVKPLPTPPPIPDTKEANVVVIIGPDQGSRFSGAATTTTQPGASTTTTAVTTTTKKP